MKLRATFGRYQLGGKEGDMTLINHMQKLEEDLKNATEAFRQLLRRDIPRTHPPDFKMEEKCQDKIMQK